MNAEQYFECWQTCAKKGDIAKAGEVLPHLQKACETRRGSYQVFFESARDSQVVLEQIEGHVHNNDFPAAFALLALLEDQVREPLRGVLSVWETKTQSPPKENVVVPSKGKALVRYFLDCLQNDDCAMAEAILEEAKGISELQGGMPAMRMQFHAAKKLHDALKDGDIVAARETLAWISPRVVRNRMEAVIIKAERERSVKSKNGQAV